MSAAHDNVVELHSADALVLVPEGTYRLAFQKSRVVTRFGRGSLELWFRIVDYGPHFQKPLVRYYKIERQGKRSFSVSPHAAYAREFAAVFRKAPPAGSQSIAWFRDVLVEARVRTVTTDSRQKPLPESARYSTIAELIGRSE